MSQIIRRPKAVQDLARIWRYMTLEASRERANAIIASIDQAFALLSSHPHAGKARPEFLEGIRSFPTGNYLILYLPMQDGIQIVRVLHSSMDIQEKVKNLH